MPTIEILFSVFAFVWGAVWGSFLNVLIHRGPRGESVLAPPSHCPVCNETIRWFHNIPLLSYVALGGKCAYCGEPISIRYPMVELIAATISLAVWYQVVYNPLVPTLTIALVFYIFMFFFAMMLIAITFIDLDHMEIPDFITLPSILVGLAFNAVLGHYHSVSLTDSFVGELAGTRFITVVILGYLLIRKQRGMGWGDMKLLGMIGAFLGWKCLIFVVLAGSLQGIVYAVCLLVASVRGRRGEEPEQGDQSREEPLEIPSLPKLGLVLVLPEMMFLPERWLDLFFGEQQESQEDTTADTGADDAESPGRMKIPFGPFLALAAFEWMFFQGWLENFFRNFFHM